MHGMHLQVSSLEAGAIFGSVLYQASTFTQERSMVVLKDIHLDVTNFMLPSHTTDVEFRRMWSDLEWENKVCVCVCVLVSRLLSLCM